MREKQFRGKLDFDGKWVYGDLIQCEGVTYVQPANSKGFVDGSFSMVMMRVDPKSVGQYTGLKDRNGVEIYEGDVVVDTFGQKHSDWQTGKVVELSPIFWSEFTEYVRDASDLEVIGNIYDTRT